MILLGVFIIFIGGAVVPQNSYGGRVIAEDGTPLAGVAVFHSGVYPGGDTQTDADGRFSIQLTRPLRPKEHPTARFSRVGYAPVTRVFAQPNDYIVTLHRSETATWAVPVCTEKTQFGGDVFMSFLLPKATKIRRGSDVDYSAQHVQFKKSWMRYGSGPTWSFGLPPLLSSYLQNIAELSERDVTFNDQVIGVEYKGKRTDGTYFRFIGKFGETIEYEHVTRETASFFDSILDTMCQHPR